MSGFILILMFCIFVRASLAEGPQGAVTLGALKIVKQEASPDHRKISVSGDFLKKGKVAVINSVAIGPDGHGHFRASIPITKHQSEIPIQIINAYGRVEEKVMWSIPKPSEPKLRRPASTDPETLPSASPSPIPSIKNHFFEPVVGLSFVSYHDNTQNDFSEVALTAKFSYSQDLGEAEDPTLPSRWRLGFSFHYTGPIKENNENGISFGGLEVKGSYRLVAANRSGGVGVLIGVGGYYLTTFENGNPYGFDNMEGPEIYPEVQYTFSGASVLSTYVKYAPTLSSGKFSFSNSQVTGGISWKVHGWNYSFDASSLSLDQGGVNAQMKIFFIGVGVEL